jgi:hypothetical protein
MSDIALRSVEMRAVSSREDWADWMSVASRVQREDPQWVPPLLAERRKQWSPRHPFWAHAQGQAWLARQAGQPVGAISAQLDPRQPPQDGRPVGYFGQFECIDQPAVARALFNEAETWLMERGCGWMRGPYDLNINQQVGLLETGHDAPPMLMMGHAPPYYAELFAAVGLVPAMRMYAYRLEPDFAAPPAMVRMLGRYQDDIMLRPLDLRRYQDELQLLRQLFNAAWADNWGFVPLSEAEFAHMGRGMRPLVRADYTVIAHYKGKPVGFLIALPNLNEVIADLNGRLLPLAWAKLLWRMNRHRFKTARVPLMGIAPHVQRSRLGAALTFAMIDKLRQALSANGVAEVELSWILESNQGMNALLENFGAEAYKHYRMFEKPLP